MTDVEDPEMYKTSLLRIQVLPAAGYEDWALAIADDDKTSVINERRDILKD